MTAAGPASAVRYDAAEVDGQAREVSRLFETKAGLGGENTLRADR